MSDKLPPDPALSAIVGLLLGIVLCAGPVAVLARSASDTNVAVEQEPPTPPSYREKNVGPFFVRVDDYERGVTCYRSTGAGGVWCYESGVTP